MTDLPIMKGITPLPWKQTGAFVFNGDGYVVADVRAVETPDEVVVVSNPGLEERDAAYISHAANLFPELVEALAEMLTYGVEMDDERIGYVTAQLDRVTIDRARAALAKAMRQFNERGPAKVEDHE